MVVVSAGHSAGHCCSKTLFLLNFSFLHLGFNDSDLAE
jgi:hypothetical protein